MSPDDIPAVDPDRFARACIAYQSVASRDLGNRFGPTPYLKAVAETLPDAGHDEVVALGLRALALENTLAVNQQLWDSFGLVMNHPVPYELIRAAAAARVVRWPEDPPEVTPRFFEPTELIHLFQSRAMH